MCFRLIKNILIGVPDPEERTATEVITNISTRITEVLPYGATIFKSVLQRAIQK